jgi:hypothetical protein
MHYGIVYYFEDTVTMFDVIYPKKLLLLLQLPLPVKFQS